MSKNLLTSLRLLRDYLQLPSNAKSECYRDFLGLPKEDPGIDRAVDEGIGWLCRAQDNSMTRDGGVARHFSLISGWSSGSPLPWTGLVTCTRSGTKASRDPSPTLRWRGTQPSSG